MAPQRARQQPREPFGAAVGNIEAIKGVFFVFDDGAWRYGGPNPAAMRGGMSRLLRLLWALALVALVVWAGVWVTRSLTGGLGPLDAMSIAVSRTGAWASQVLEDLSGGLESFGKGDDQQQAVRAQGVVIDLDPSASSAVRKQVSAAIAPLLPVLINRGDEFILRHPVAGATAYAIWAQRTKTLMGRDSAAGLAAYTDAGDKGSEGAVMLVPDGTLADRNGRLLITALLPSHSALTGIADAWLAHADEPLSREGASWNRVAVRAITDKQSTEQAHQELLAGAYPVIESVDDVLVGLDVDPSVARTLGLHDTKPSAVLVALMVAVGAVLLVVCVLLGMRAARYKMTVQPRRNTGRELLAAIAGRLAFLHDATLVRLLRAFLVLFVVWMVLALIAGAAVYGLVWLVAFFTVGYLIALNRFRIDENTLTALTARSLQLNRFDEEAVAAFAKANSVLVNDGAERIIAPYVTVGTASAHASKARLMDLWVNIMGKPAHELEETLERQQRATFNLILEANRVVVEADGEGQQERVIIVPPTSGPVFGLIKKGFRGSARSKRSEGHAEPSDAGRPALVKMFATAKNNLHAWLDERALASRARKLEAQVAYRRQFGEALQDARTLTEQLDARSMQQWLQQAQLKVSLAEAREREAQVVKRGAASRAEASEEFDHSMGEGADDKT